MPMQREITARWSPITGLVTTPESQCATSARQREKRTKYKISCSTIPWGQRLYKYVFRTPTGHVRWPSRRLELNRSEILVMFQKWHLLRIQRKLCLKMKGSGKRRLEGRAVLSGAKMSKATLRPACGGKPTGTQASPASGAA